MIPTNHRIFIKIVIPTVIQIICSKGKMKSDIFLQVSKKEGALLVVM